MNSGDRAAGGFLARNGKLIGWATLVACVAALEYLVRFASGTPDRDVLYRYSTAVGSAVVYGIFLLVVLAIAGWRTELLALRRPPSWPRAIGLAVLLLIGIYIAVALLDPLLHGSREQGLTPLGWQPDHAGAFIANFVVVALVAPVVEELTFRGLGFSLLERFGKWTAIVVVGACFALDHGLVQAFPELLIFGCALAWLRWRTGSVFPGMLVHAAFNALALIAAVST
jgi:membrane protease YdiL (CAAX protease family)